MPRGERLLKLWNDWSAGIGYMRDDGATPGLYNAVGIVGGQNDLRAAQFKNNCDYSAQATATDMAATYFFDENISSTTAVLYAVCNRIGSAIAEIVKIRLDYANFATAVTTDTSSRNVAAKCGKPARYLGAWYIPSTASIQKVSAFSVSADDTWTAGGTGGTHLAMINHQLAEVATGSGARILGEYEAPTTGTWGSFFGIGDRDETAADMFAIGGLMFVLKKSGLYSFGTKNGRTVSGMILEDFGRWRASFANLPTAMWKGGTVIPHPAGLLFYTPGEPFTPIGLEARAQIEGVAAAGVTELQVGRYHGCAAAGDYLYTVYQPDPASTAAVILSGYSPGAFPSDIAWQCIGSLTLAGNADDGVHGVHLSALGYPESTNEANPVLWFSDAASGTRNLSYVVLDSRGQPLRGRANTHKVVTSGNAWMSEIFFDEPQELSRVVVYADDMADGDEWQVSAVYNSTGADIKMGATVIASGRHERLIKRRDVYRLVLHVNFVGTSTASRVPPTIKRIELWGPEGPQG